MILLHLTLGQRIFLFDFQMLSSRINVKQSSLTYKPLSIDASESQVSKACNQPVSQGS